jgi:hypothetical protein
MKYLKLGFLLIGILFSSNGNSQISTDRPGASDASSTVMKNSFQIEQGFDMNFYKEDTINFRAFSMPSLFRIGVLNWLELRLQNNVVSLYNKTAQTNTFGIADIQIGFKAQLLKKEGVNCEIAFVSMWGMPIGTEGLSTGKFSTMNKLSFGHSLSKKVSLTYNVGYGYYGFGKGLFAYTMSFGFQLVPKLNLFVENFGSYDDFRTFTTSVDAGLSYLITDWVQIDVAYGTGLNWRYNYAQIGVSWNIHKKEKNNDDK